jgi:hypothetical protein
LRSRQALDFDLTHYLLIVRFDEQTIPYKYTVHQELGLTPSPTCPSRARLLIPGEAAHHNEVIAPTVTE